jgi:hypothetical protein
MRIFCTRNIWTPKFPREVGVGRLEAPGIINTINGKSSRKKRKILGEVEGRAAPGKLPGNGAAGLQNHLGGTGEAWTRNSVSIGNGIYKSSLGRRAAGALHGEWLSQLAYR